jgi:hypothetical protein
VKESGDSFTSAGKYKFVFVPAPSQTCRPTINPPENGPAAQPDDPGLGALRSNRPG